MHRSGTSLTAAALVALGATLPRDLMPATAENAQGYFESVTIQNENDAILSVLERTWENSSTLQPLPPGWIEMPAVQARACAIRAYLDKELAASSGPLLIKDPRMAQLLPLWLPLLAGMGLAVRVALTVRHPAEVAASLHARNKIALAAGELLWLEHIADALTAPAIDFIAPYDAWFTAPERELSAAAQALDLPPPTEAAIQRVRSEVVDSGLRHHRTPDAGFYLPFTREFYDALNARDVNRARNILGMFAPGKAFASGVAQIVASIYEAKAATAAP